MRVWFDVLTPKQLAFFEPLIAKAGQRHKVLVTSRFYPEARELARVRRMKGITYRGVFGGETLAGKLKASIERLGSLYPAVDTFWPDALICSHSPEALRIAYGLRKPAIMTTDAPHNGRLMRLTVPLATAVLVPWIIPKSDIVQFGTSPDQVIQYKAIDGAITVKRLETGARPKWLPEGGHILVRPPETQAAYGPRKDITPDIVRAMWARTEKPIIVLARYDEQAAYVRRSVGRKAAVVTMSGDGPALLDGCDAFIGSGGTMTAEAAYYGVPTVSYNAVPNRTEQYLVTRRYVARAESAAGAAILAARMMKAREKYGILEIEKKAMREGRGMVFPFREISQALKGAGMGAL